MTPLISLLASNPFAFVLIALGLVIAVTIHEFAHAWTADKLGDPTARVQDRVTLNPLAHLDPIGTIMLLLVGFGWGKPVPFDPYNLKEPLRDGALIALAGPLSNMIMAGLCSLALHLLGLPLILSIALQQIILVNLVLAIFNLIPVHPLDGSKILMALLPEDTAHEYQDFMERYGMFVLLALLIPWNGASPVSQIIGPIISTFASVLI